MPVDKHMQGRTRSGHMEASALTNQNYRCAHKTVSNDAVHLLKHRPFDLQYLSFRRTETQELHKDVQKTYAQK